MLKNNWNFFNKSMSLIKKLNSNIGGLKKGSCICFVKQEDEEIDPIVKFIRIKL